MTDFPIWACLNAHNSSGYLMKNFHGMPIIYWVLQETLDLPTVKQVIILANDEEAAPIMAWLRLPEVRSLLPASQKVTVGSRHRLEESRAAFHQKHPQAYYAYISATAPLISTQKLKEALMKLEASSLSIINAAHLIKAPLWHGQEPLSGVEKTVWIPSEAFWISTTPHDLKPSERLFISIPKEVSPIRSETGLAAAQAYARLQFPETNIRLFLTDVDGVMTDGGMIYQEGAGQAKRFFVHDGMALQQLQQSGVVTGIITSEDTEIVTRRAEKLGVDYLYQGKRFGGKLETAMAICEELGITLADTAYIGDDINCKPLLEQVGVAACPSNATRQIKSIPGIWVMHKAGGQGAVREFIERLFPMVI